MRVRVATASCSATSRGRFGLPRHGAETRSAGRRGAETWKVHIPTPCRPWRPPLSEHGPEIGEEFRRAQLQEVWCSAWLDFLLLIVEGRANRDGS